MSQVRSSSTTADAPGRVRSSRLTIAPPMRTGWYAGLPGLPPKKPGLTNQARTWTPTAERSPKFQMRTKTR